MMCHERLIIIKNKAPKLLTTILNFQIFLHAYSFNYCQKPKRKKETTKAISIPPTPKYFYMLYPRTDTSCPQFPKLKTHALLYIYRMLSNGVRSGVLCLLCHYYKLLFYSQGCLQCMRLIPVSVSLKCLASANLLVQSINVSDTLIQIAVLFLKRKCIRNWKYCCEQGARLHDKLFDSCILVLMICAHQGVTNIVVVFRCICRKQPKLLHLWVASIVFNNS